MSKSEKEPKKTEKGFSTALLLNLSPFEGTLKELNEGVDNNTKLNTSASAAQDSTTRVKDFLSLDLLEKIEAESPLVKLKEKNNNKSKEIKENEKAEEEEINTSTKNKKEEKGKKENNIN